MSRRPRFRAWAAAGALAVALAVALPATAAAFERNPSGRLLGAVPARGATPFRAKALAAAGTLPLTYHGGAVVHDGHVYAILWEPPGYAFPAGYREAIAKYFTDVAADSGKRTNVYSVNRQYGDALGKAVYKVAYAGAFTDSASLPSSGCTNPQTSVCVTDDQLAGELGRFVAATGLPTGLTRQYFVFTPPGVGSCFEGDSDPCAYSNYCAYHSYATWPGTLLYAVHPYVAGVGSCDVGQSPTGTGADAVLNVVSHEHNEIVTDPTGGGWYDMDGEENGDKCAWTFGTPSGANGAYFNQVVRGSPYLLQHEWSNLRGGCVGSEANRRPSAYFAPSGRKVAGKKLVFDAHASRDVDGRIAKFAWRFGDGVRKTGPLAMHGYSRKGTYHVRLTVTDDEGASSVRTLDVRVKAKRKR